MWPGNRRPPTGWTKPGRRRVHTRRADRGPRRHLYAGSCTRSDGCAASRSLPLTPPRSTTAPGSSPTGAGVSPDVRIVRRRRTSSLGRPVGTGWERKWERALLSMAQHRSDLLTPAPPEPCKRGFGQAVVSVLHSWGSRGRRFKSGRPDAGQMLAPGSRDRPFGAMGAHARSHLLCRLDHLACLAPASGWPGVTGNERVRTLVRALRRLLE
jgi:hypothetical protein